MRFWLTWLYIVSAQASKYTVSSEFLNSLLCLGLSVNWLLTMSIKCLKKAYNTQQGAHRKSLAANPIDKIKRTSTIDIVQQIHTERTEVFLCWCSFCGAFYPRDAMLARVFAIATCPSVRPSVCLSVRPPRAGIVPSSAKAGSWNVYHLIAPSL